MIHKICFFFQIVTLLAGAFATIQTIADPPVRLTTYFRTHQYDAIYNPPTREADVMQMVVRLAAIGMASVAVCVALGMVRSLPDRSIDKERVRSELAQLDREAAIADLVQSRQRKEKRNWIVFLMSAGFIAVVLLVGEIFYLIAQSERGYAAAPPPVPGWAQPPIIINESPQESRLGDPTPSLNPAAPQ